MKIKSFGVSVVVGGELSGPISMRSGIPQGFVNDLLGAREVLSLIFAGNAIMVTRRTQNINLHIFLTTAWD